MEPNDGSNPKEIMLLEGGKGMLLLRGVTGFQAADDVMEEPDVNTFKKICYAVLVPNGGKVLSYQAQAIDTNYEVVRVEIFQKAYFLLLNAAYPFLAFADRMQDGVFHFIDEEALAGLFRPYYHVVSKAELDAPIVIRPENKKDPLPLTHQLSTEELEEIWYWQPKTVGEIIYNHWD